MSGLGIEIAMWRGASGVTDLTGNGFNATQVGGLVPSDDGGIDVWHFDDIDDGLSLPLASLPSAYPCAISFWCKKEAGDSTIGSLSTSSATTPFIYFGIDNADGKSVLYANPAAKIQVKPTTVVGDDAWAFIVCNFESSSSRTIRVNDLTEATNTTTGPVLSSFNQFNFGRLVRTTTGYYKGKVNDIHVYDRALTTEEITELYTGGQNYDRPAPPTFNPAWAAHATQVCQ